MAPVSFSDFGFWQLRGARGGIEIACKQEKCASFLNYLPFACYCGYRSVYALR